jgi:hypothetical protein
MKQLKAILAIFLTLSVGTFSIAHPSSPSPYANYQLKTCSSKSCTNFHDSSAFAQCCGNNSIGYTHKWPASAGCRKYVHAPRAGCHAGLTVAQFAALVSLACIMLIAIALGNAPENNNNNNNNSTTTNLHPRSFGIGHSH